MPWRVSYRVKGFDHLGEQALTYEDLHTAVVHLEDIAGYDRVYDVTLNKVKEEDDAQDTPTS